MVINPTKASEEKRLFAVSKLKQYGIVDAERRVEVYETSFKKYATKLIQRRRLCTNSVVRGERNNIYSIGTRYDIKIFVPSPFFASPDTRLGDLYPGLDEFNSTLANQTLASADNLATFIEDRKEAIISQRVLPLSQRENDFAWRAAAAYIQVKANTRPLGIGLLSIGGLWLTGKLLLRPPMVSSIHPFIQNRLAELPLLLSLAGMLWAGRTVGEIMVHKIVGNSAETAQLGIQYTTAQQVYNIVRAKWYIDAHGNDLTEILPASRRIQSYNRCIQDISEISDMRHVLEAGDVAFAKILAETPQPTSESVPSQESNSVVEAVNK